MSEKFKSNFPNTYHYCNKDLEKFILSLRKGKMCHEYIGSWEKINGKSLPLKEKTFSELDIEEISVKDYRHAQKYEIC